MKISYDSEANALAITMRDSAVDRTEQLDAGTLVDLNAEGQLVTIEVINPTRSWPLDLIAERFELSEADVRVLKQLYGGQGTYGIPTTVGVGSDRELELAAG